MKLTRWHAVAAILAIQALVTVVAAWTMNLGAAMQIALGAAFGWAVVMLPTIAYWTRPTRTEETSR